MEKVGFKLQCSAEDWETKKNITSRDSWKVTINFCRQNKKITMDKAKICYFSDHLSTIFCHYGKDEKDQTFTFDIKNIKNDDGKCFKILRKYLKNGCVSEEGLSKTTVENLSVLAQNLQIKPLENSCRELLRTRESFESISCKIDENSQRKKSQKEPKTVVDQVAHVLSDSSDKTPSQLSNNLFEVLKLNNHPIERFQKHHAAKIDYLQKLGWNGIKKEYGQRMDNPEHDPDESGVSFTKFRDLANELVLEVLNGAAIQLGIGKIGVDIFGTNGYNSDKDITMRSAGELRLTTEDMVLMKCIADLVTVKLLGQLPGIALDTEWYVDLRFFGDHATSEKAKTEINTLNLAMAIMHAKEGFKEEAYGDFKKQELELSCAPIKPVKRKLFLQVEKLYATIDDEVKYTCQFQNQENQEWLLYNGKVLSQYPRLLSLGKQCGSLERKIEQMLSSDNHNQEEFERLIVLHDLLYAMINSRQPEGTMSWPELKTTLFSFIGQKTVGQTEKTILLSEEQFRKKKIFDGPLSPRKIRDGFKIMKKCEETEVSRKSVCIQDLILSGEERRVQFSYTIQSKGIVHAGKYFLRVAESCYYALEKCFKESKRLDENGRKELAALWEKAKKLYARGLHFEQCKRGKKLNAIAFAVMLHSALEKRGCKIDESELEKMIFMDEPGGLWRRFRVSPQEKFATMLEFLVKKKYLSKTEANDIAFGKELPEDLAQIRRLLCARAGIQMPVELIQKAEELTCAYYNVETPNAELRIHDNVQKFYLEVEDFMLKYGYLGAFSVQSAEKLDFEKIWKK